MACCTEASGAVDTGDCCQRALLLKKRAKAAVRGTARVTELVITTKNNTDRSEAMAAAVLLHSTLLAASACTAILHV